MCLAKSVIVTHVCFLSLELGHIHCTGLIWQVREAMMSARFTGWLTWCRNFDGNWWCHLFSCHQLAFQLFISWWKIHRIPRWLVNHWCQQMRDDHLALQKEETTSTCEFNVDPSNRRRLCLPVCVSVSMPLSINREALSIGRFTSTTVKPTRSS